MPNRAGDQYTCFIVIQGARGWFGSSRAAVLECEVCHERVSALAQWDLKLRADAHPCASTPCLRCGVMLLRRKNGTPRQHASQHCSEADVA